MIPLIKLLELLSSKQVIVFEGEWGTGKTLSMVEYVRMMVQYTGIRKILSKMPVFYPNIPGIEYSPLIQTSQFEHITDTIIEHDELLDDLDRRDSLSPRNKYFTRFAKVFRKIRCQEVGTVQYISMVDERLIEMMQILITPKWKRKYHKDVKIDAQIREEKRDYRMYWFVCDLKANREYNIILDVSSSLGCYDTNYIPNKLAVTHKEYLDWFEITQSKNKYELHNRITQEIIESSTKEWLEGQKGLQHEW